MLTNIKNNYVFRNILKLVPEKLYLKLFNYNKKLQEKSNVSINTYKKLFNQIEIEIIPINELVNEKNEFINGYGDRAFYHIYFDNEKKEIKRNYITKQDKISKIKVALDMEIESLSALFQDCICIKEIKFIKFNRIDITDMSNMFDGCKSLTNLDISILKTDNVNNMRYMFGGCTSLKELDLSKFITNNVVNMAHMFRRCCSLEKLDISKFKTNNVVNMSYMFCNCSKLNELDISNFETDKVVENGLYVQ